MKATPCNENQQRYSPGKYACNTAMAAIISRFGGPQSRFQSFGVITRDQVACWIDGKTLPSTCRTTWRTTLFRCKFWLTFRAFHDQLDLQQIALIGWFARTRAMLLDKLWAWWKTSNHRERTLLLNRKRVNKGMKRTNSLPLSPVVLTRPYCKENRYLQVLRSIVALN